MHAGQLVGTLFSHEGARSFQEKHDRDKAQQARDKDKSNGKAQPTAGDDTARELAVAARDASRVLQNLSSEVGVALAAAVQCTPLQSSPGMLTIVWS